MRHSGASARFCTRNAAPADGFLKIVDRWSRHSVVTDPLSLHGASCRRKFHEMSVLARPVLAGYRKRRVPGRPEAGSAGGGRSQGRVGRRRAAGRPEAGGARGRVGRSQGRAAGGGAAGARGRVGRSQGRRGWSAEVLPAARALVRGAVDRDARTGADFTDQAPSNWERYLWGKRGDQGVVLTAG
jgi:hypothetical protein